MNSPLAIHHVQVAMPSGREADARVFYADMLGFTEIPKPVNLVARGGVWFQTGNLQLHVGVEEPFVPARKAHVAYQVSDLKDMKSRLQAVGYQINIDEPLPGYDRLYTEDPFGNRIELLTPIQNDS